MKLRVLLRICFSVFGALVMVAPKVYAADLRFSLQDDYATLPAVSTPVPRAFSTTRQVSPERPGAPEVPSVNNRVWTISGHALLSGRNQTMETFLSFSEDQIRKRLKTYLAEKPALNSQTDDLIILDMEFPIHPKDIGQYAGKEQVQIIEAFKTRIKIARQELSHAKLAIYGVIVPNAVGNSSNAKFQQMMQGYIKAGQLGMFDEVDYLSPVLYLRFGPGEKGYNAMEAYTRQGIEASRLIKTSKGMPLPLAPLLTFKVANANSKKHDQCLPMESLQKQMKIINGYPYVQTVVMWAGTMSDKWCWPKNVTQTINSLKVDK